ncbi:MAG: hypothetical protein MUC73_11700 [Cyclobacteriaceae bacterium]|nr:hypothetical protein [Cyclobacteriaceae bacterium]
MLIQFAFVVSNVTLARFAGWRLQATVRKNSVKPGIFTGETGMYDQVSGYLKVIQHPKYIKTH